MDRNKGRKHRANTSNNNLTEMKKIHLLLIAILLSFGLKAQVFTPIHNYQAPDGMKWIKLGGIPYGPDTTFNGVNPSIKLCDTCPTLHKVPGFLFYQTTDSTLYVWAGTKWISVGRGSGGGGSSQTIVYVKDDLTVDSTTNPGFQTLGRLHNDGLDPNTGIVTSAGCLLLHVTQSSWYLNHGTHYFAAGINLTVSTPDGSLPRIDRIVGDTLGNVFIITGTPSTLPQAPPYNAASQISIATYPVGAGATCLAINSIIIYDETGGTEYTPSTVGAITQNTTNTANPEHGVNANYISSYIDGTKFTWKKTSGQDTVFSNSVFRFGFYLFHPFTNQLEMQLFRAGVSVSNNIVLNPYISTLDTSEYQTVAVPKYAFGASGDIIEDSIVFTLRGIDNSGAGGLYFDYFQLQTGLTNSSPSLYLTTDSTSGPATLVGNHLNIPVYGGGSGGGDSTLQQIFNTEHARAILLVNDTIDVQAIHLHIVGNGGLFDARIVNGVMASIISNTGTQNVISSQDNTGSSIVSSLTTASNRATLQTQESSTLMKLSTYKDSLIVANNNGTYLRIDEVDGGIKLPQYQFGDFNNNTPLYLLSMNTNGYVTSTDATTGDLLYGNGSNRWAKLGVGSDGEVLTVSAGVPSWQTVSGGAQTLQQTWARDSTASQNINVRSNQFEISDSAHNGFAIAGGSLLLGNSTSLSGFIYDNSDSSLLLLSSSKKISASLDSVANPQNIVWIDNNGYLHKGVSSAAHFIYNEEFTGSTSTTLTLSHNYTSGTIRLFKNGARLRASDFTEATANTITLGVARLSGDVFITDFNY